VKIPIIILIITSLILTSCEIMPTEEETEKITEKLTGNQGISMNFVPNIPPTRVYEGDITVMIQLENKGTYDLPEKQGTIYLSGFDDKIINIKEVKTGMDLPKLDGRSLYRKQGDIEQQTFTGTINKLTVEKYNTIILATNCYKYKTKAASAACIDPDPYTTAGQPKICTPTNIAMSGGQGAPIGITKIEVDPAKGKTRFAIHIKNIGTGTAYKDTEKNKCNPYSNTGLSFTDINLIKVEEIEISDKKLNDLECKPLDNDKYLRLTNGEGTIYCTMNTGTGAAYITPISITLSYGYRDTATKQIEVRKT